MSNYHKYRSSELPKTLTVNNTPYDYPTSSDEPGWGGEATGWAEEVTTVLNNLLGPNDILETSFSIANNQIVAADVTGLAFNAGSVRSAVVEYAVYRISDANPSGNAESGEVHLVYDDSSGWLMGVGGIVGNSGVQLSITSSGQVQYTSTNIDAINYSGVIKFKATALSQ